MVAQLKDFPESRLRKWTSFCWSETLYWLDRVHCNKRPLHWEGSPVYLSWPEFSKLGFTARALCETKAEVIELVQLGVQLPRCCWCSPTSFPWAAIVFCQPCLLLQPWRWWNNLPENWVVYGCKGRFDVLLKIAGKPFQIVKQTCEAVTCL